MVEITPLLHAVTVLSLTLTDSTSRGLAARQAIDPSSLPSACQSSCQVVNTISSCDGSLTCECTSTVGSQLQQCMTCLVNAVPSVESEAQSALSSWNEACGGNLSLGGSSSSGGTTGGTTTGSSSSSSSPLGSQPGGATGLKIGGVAVCIVAALAGALISF